MDSLRGVKICYLADKHDLYDDRIYWKMAVPMKKLGAEVHYYLIGPQNEDGTTAEGISYRIWKLKSYSHNPFVNFVIKRLNPSNNYKKLFEACAELKADLYHFHDLWLNRIGPRLKALPHGPVVFYDAREPYAEDYRSFQGTGGLSKVMINAFASWVDSWEKRKASRYDLVIANESQVRQKFVRVIGQEKSVVLHNFLDHELFESDLRDVKTSPMLMNSEVVSKSYDLLHCGLLTKERGAWNILHAIRSLLPRFPELKVLILGKIDPPELREEMIRFVRDHGLEETVEFRSQVPHEQVGKYYTASRIGLLLWRPVPSLKIKMPIKLFEYMAFGLPIVGSNFGHIAELIERESCGIAVDPENQEEVLEALETLLRQEETYTVMSQKGIVASQGAYNWQIELNRLCGYYKKSLDER